MSATFCKCACAQCKSQPDGVGHIDMAAGREVVSYVDAYGRKEQFYPSLDPAFPRAEYLATSITEMNQREAAQTAALENLGLDPTDFQKQPTGCGCGS